MDRNRGVADFGRNFLLLIADVIIATLFFRRIGKASSYRRAMVCPDD
jgi:hypothetical protein